MAARYGRLFRRFLLLLNVFIAILFLLSCIAPYLDPQKWWLISIIGLGFIPLLILMILFLILWLIFRMRYVLISLIPLLLAFKSIAVLFAFNSPKDFNYQKNKDVLRVVHWNVARFVEWKRNNNKGSQTRLKMMEQLKEQNADVLCLVEFFHSTDSVYYNNLNYVMRELGYPYFYYSWEGDGYKQWVGQAIFSKHPIIDSGVVTFPEPGQKETLINADILFNKDTLRIYTTHLQTVGFKKQDYESIEKIKNTEDSLLENSRNIFSKLKRGFVFRSRQATIVKEAIGSSPYPYVISGDFNDVPNSYSYFTIKNNLQDAFLRKGFGIGRTYSFIAPTLRIDYILATNDFKVAQFNRLVKNYSDHYMLVADFKIKEVSNK